MLKIPTEEMRACYGFNRRLMILVITFCAVLTLYRSANTVKWSSIDTSIYDYTKIVRNNIDKYKQLELPRDSSEARPFLRLKSWYRIAPRYKLTGCIVEKNMCTIVQGIMCYLFDTEGYTGSRRKMASEAWTTRWCGGRNEPATTQERKLVMPYPVETVFIARDPMERFLSGFINKCIHEKNNCYGCPGQILCVLEGIYGDLMTISKRYHRVDSKRDRHIPVSYEAQHMAPQSWYCDLFDEAPSTIFIRYGERGVAQEDMRQNLIKVFRQHGVEEYKVEYIQKALSEYTTHTTKNSPLKQSLKEDIMGSRKHLQMFMQIFKYDYEIFDFKKPIG